jgi:Ca2+-binding EF-hand superfamily protein
MRKFLLTLAVVGGSALCSPLFAEEGDFFTQLDANKDGFITDNEVEGSKKALFERLVRVADENGDKKLSKEEFAKGTQKSTEEKPPLAGEPRRPGSGGGGIPNPKEFLSRLDKNGDGKISKDEAPDRMKENFDRLDVNKDGFIGLDEFGRGPAGLGGRPAGTPPGASLPGGLPPLPVLRALDADNDGEISKAEIEGAAKALAALDKNGDGKLSRDEILPNMPAGGFPGRPGAEGRPGQPGQPGAAGRPNPEELLRRLKEADKNGDGKISKDEAPERMKENFDRIDANGDGQIDETEVKAMVERLREAAGRRPEGRPERKPDEKKE